MGKKESYTNPVRGFNIYLDDLDRYVYYDYFTNQGYLLLEKNTKQFYFYQNRFLYIAILMILLASFVPNIWLCLGVGALAALVFEYFFRMKYLPSLTRLGSFKKERKASSVTRKLNPDTKGKLMLKSLLYVVLAVLLVLNAYIEAYEPWLVGLSCLIAVVAIFIAIYNFRLGLRG